MHNDAGVLGVHGAALSRVLVDNDGVRVREYHCFGQLERDGDNAEDEIRHCWDFRYSEYMHYTLLDPLHPLSQRNRWRQALRNCGTFSSMVPLLCGQHLPHSRSIPLYTLCILCVFFLISHTRCDTFIGWKTIEIMDNRTVNYVWTPFVGWATATVSTVPLTLVGVVSLWLRAGIRSTGRGVTPAYHAI